MGKRNDLRDRRETLPHCTHKSPSSTTGALGMTQSCACGAVTYVLRNKGNDGSNRPDKRWDRY